MLNASDASGQNLTAKMIRDSNMTNTAPLNEGRIAQLPVKGAR